MAYGMGLAVLRQLAGKVVAGLTVHTHPELGEAYAASMRGGRDLKLSGYEVFRFGATELQNPERARTLLQQFFADLFRRFGVTPRTD